MKSDVWVTYLMIIEVDESLRKVALRLDSTVALQMCNKTVDDYKYDFKGQAPIPLKTHHDMNRYH